MSTVSVIIPVFNRKDIIGYTLDSLQPQLHPGVTMEIIAVDDGSTDGVMDLVRQQFPEVIILENSGKGAATARNTGLRVAKGDYVLYLDSDDLVGPGFFKNKIEMLEADKRLSGCYGQYDFFKSDGAFTESFVIFKHKYPANLTAADTRQHIINNFRGNFIPPIAIVWRKSFLLEIGGHEAGLPINQDVELFVRAAFNGLQMPGVVDGTRVFARTHSLDDRVGTADSPVKLESILTLRKRFYATLKQSSYANDTACYEALSIYLFNFWKKLRHKHPGLAAEYLALAKQVYWPVKIKGNLLFSMLGKLLGPDKAVNIKYSILKRD